MLCGTPRRSRLIPWNPEAFRTRKGWHVPFRIFACALLAGGTLFGSLGCETDLPITKDVLKPLTIIREVEMRAEEGGSKAIIQGDTPFEYRIFSDPRLQAVVVRISDAIYDREAGRRQEFPKGPISQVEVLQRKALIQVVEVRLYARTRLPLVDKDRDLNHVREGSKVVITWRASPEGQQTAAQEGKGRKPGKEKKEGRQPEGKVGSLPALKPIPKEGSPTRAPLQLPPSLLPRPQPEEYRVGSKDVLKVGIYREPDLSGDYVIAGDGTINFPLLGHVRVEGKTVSEIEKQLETQLAKDYLVNPSVSVRVGEYRSQQIQLLGAVKKPGTYTLRGPTTLLEIISQAGGIDPREGGSKVIVLRPRKGKEGEDLYFTVNLDLLLKGADLSANIPLHRNDTVYVPKADSIFIFGQVKSPGPYKIQKKITLAEAISMAGGLTRLAAANRTRVVRIEGGTERVLHIPLDDILKGDKTKDILLVAEDIVFVPESFF